jgi:hypothetical protein
VKSSANELQSFTSLTHNTMHTAQQMIGEVAAGTLIAAFVALSVHLLFEPVVTSAQAVSDQFIVTQSITSEIAFVTTANDVTMSAIAGLTGGAATNSTQVVIYTNDNAGYTMTITASGSPAMQGDTQGGSINNYSPASPFVPDFAKAPNSSGGAAEFGFTVSASTTSDLATKFLDNGSACSTGSSDTGGANSCWYFIPNSATSTIVRSSETAGSGSTSTIFFHTHVPGSPSPALPEDTYRATSTLTATMN